MYLDLRGDLAPATKLGQERTLRFLKEYLGEEKIVSNITPLDARRFIACYRERKYRDCTPAPATVNKIVRDRRQAKLSEETRGASLVPAGDHGVAHVGRSCAPEAYWFDSPASWRPVSRRTSPAVSTPVI